jgi:hypothetical protein
MVLCDQEGERVQRPPHVLIEIVSPAGAVRDEHLKFEIAEREGVPYYVLVYPQRQVAKIYGWREGRYVKAADCARERFDFQMGACRATLDFARVWPEAG